MPTKGGILVQRTSSRLVAVDGFMQMSISELWKASTGRTVRREGPFLLFGSLLRCTGYQDVYVDEGQGSWALGRRFWARIDDLALWDLLGVKGNRLFRVNIRTKISFCRKSKENLRIASQKIRFNSVLRP